MKLLTLANIRLILRATSKNVKQVSTSLFSKHLFATNVFISVSTSGIGDIIEQMFEIVAKVESSWNRQRTLKMASTGLSVGILAHYWYKILDARRKSLAQKIFLTQLVYSPICLVAFFVTLGILNRSPWREVLDNFLEKGRRIYVAEWFIWPLALIVNFGLVPLRYRILFDSSVSLGFDVYSSYVVYR